MIERAASDLPLTTQTELLSLNRSSLYYQPHPARAEEVQLKHRIDEVYTQSPFYRARRIAAQLQREGMSINWKTVGQYMKAVLDALRDELCKQNYLPILFDLKKLTSRDFTEIVSTLAHLLRFIIADVIDESSIPQELQAIVPVLSVPIQPLLLVEQQPYAMFKDFRKYLWVLPPYHYLDQGALLAVLDESIIKPADEHSLKLHMITPSGYKLRN